MQIEIMNYPKLQFRRAGTQICKTETEILDLFLSGQSVEDLALDYNETTSSVENALRIEFIRIRDGILKAFHSSIEQQANLELRLQEFTYQESFKET